MNDTGLALLGLLVGALLSFSISWYFFKKSINKRLSAYLQFSSQVLAGVDDPTVRKSLEIHYRGSKIDDLLQLQFVIANEGQRAIRDMLEPLSMTLPSSVKLLEARVLHVEPKGREVTVSSVVLENGKTKVTFNFNLLNKDEFFFIKMLLNGTVDPDSLLFNIGVDDIPPTIHPKRQPFGTAKEPVPSGWPAVARGMIPLMAAIATVYILQAASRTHPEWLPNHIHFAWLSVPTIAMLTSVCGIVYWLSLAIRSIVFRGLRRTAHRFRMPQPPPSKPYAGGFYPGYIEPEAAAELLNRLNHMPPPMRRRYMRELGMLPPRMIRPTDSTESQK